MVILKFISFNVIVVFMPLVESLPVLDEIIDAPPVKLEYGHLAIPQDVDFTFIGVEHDYRFGEPDYAEAVLKGADVFFYELMGWTPELQKRLQRIAGGDWNSRNKQRDIDSLSAQSSDEQVAFQAQWDMALHAALYMSGVRVELPDYPHNHRGFNPDDYLIIGDSHQDNDPTRDIDTFRLWQRREQFNLDSICSSIAAIREGRSKLVSKSPLKVVAVYGWLHNSISDALVAAAAAQGIDSFKAQSMYQAVDLARIEQYFEADGAAVLREDYAAINLFSVNYCNWLRTPDKP
jgi:hypothetical protein